MLQPLRESDTSKVNLLHNAGPDGEFVVMLLLHFQVLDMQSYDHIFNIIIAHGVLVPSLG